MERKVWDEIERKNIEILGGRICKGIAHFPEEIERCLGNSVKDPEIRTLVIGSVHGACLIFEGKHFVVDHGELPEADPKTVILNSLEYKVLDTIPKGYRVSDYHDWDSEYLPIHCRYPNGDLMYGSLSVVRVGKTLCEFILNCVNKYHVSTIAQAERAIIEADADEDVITLCTFINALKAIS